MSAGVVMGIGMGTMVLVIVAGGLLLHWLDMHDDDGDGEGLA